MMTAIGFCRVHQDDVPIDTYARCVEHGGLTLAPSWGHKDQRWIDGAWWPAVEPKDTSTARWRAFLKMNERKVARRQATAIFKAGAKPKPTRRGNGTPAVRATCPTCAIEFVAYSKGKRGRMKFCSVACANKAKVGIRVKASPGRWAYRFDACVLCGTTATKHEAFGRCRNCYQATRDHWRVRQRARRAEGIAS